MNRILVLLPIVFLVQFSACRKSVFKKEITIHVVDSLYGLPVENCDVRLFQDAGVDAAGYVYSGFDESEITDKDGIANFDLRVYKNKKASNIEVLTMRNTTNNGETRFEYFGFMTLSPESLKKRNKFIVEYPAVPGVLKLIAVKVSSDPMVILSNFTVGPPIISIDGCEQDSCIYYANIHAQVWTKIKWQIWDKSDFDARTDFVDSIICQLHDTVTFRIEF